MKILLIIYICILCVLAVSDILSKSISLIQILFLLVISVVRFIFLVKSNDISFIGGLVSCLPGFIFILLSVIYPKDIGLGDGLVLAITELGCSIVVCNISLLISLTSAFSISLLLKLINHFKKTNLISIPFIPFIALGVVITEVIL